MIRLGCNIPAWHNCKNMRLTPNGSMWRKYAFGIWGYEGKAHQYNRNRPDSLVNYFYNYSASKSRLCGILFRWEAAWFGVHYSPYNRRFCINLVPFVTIWVCLKGGKVPHDES